MSSILLPENLKYLRELNGLKQAEMLDEIGFKRTTWNGYESGSSQPVLEDMIKIADYFGITESDLLHTSISTHDISLLYYKYLTVRKNATGPQTQHARNYLSWANGGKRLPASYLNSEETIARYAVAETAGKYVVAENMTDAERIERLERIIQGLVSVLKKENMI